MLIRYESWACTDSYNYTTMGLNYYASSSVLVAPAQNHLGLYSSGDGMSGMLHHPDAGAVLEPAAAAFGRSSATGNGTRKMLSRYPKPPSLNYLARSSNGVAGRKRSRDENDFDADGLREELEASSRVTVAESSKSKPEPVQLLGPVDMSLMHVDEPMMAESISSESTLWNEEQIDAERPSLTSRKSLRLADEAATVMPVDDALADTIDPIIRKLGIGWKVLSRTPDALNAGSEAFIRKQFDMYNPKLLLFHEGLGIYVVSSEPFSAPGYWQQFWLFREDLKSCRFLCRDESELFGRLSNKRQDERGSWVPDIVCEGPERQARDCSAPEPLPESSPVKGLFNLPVEEQLVVPVQPQEQQQQGGGVLPISFSRQQSRQPSPMPDVDMMET